MFGEVRLGDIVQNIESQDWRLFLCKPDYTVIAPIKDVTDLSWNIRAGKVDEMSFTIPAQVDIDHGVATNPLIKKIKHRYLFKLIYNNRETYLIFSEDDKSYSNDESVSFKAYGLGYMLRDKTIRDWSATSKNIQYMLDEVLQETNWKVGFVDADINSKYRSHEVSNNNVLEIVYELAEKFGGLIVWDTVNKVINIYKPENVGKDKGFRLREGKYLESFSQNTNSDDVVTRLKVYGKDGLTFRRLSPTGSNYIEDFSWFLYPFEQDGQGRVIKHSNYMSDGLASGIVEYQNHLASIQGNFESLTTQLTSKQDEIKQREQELSILLTDLKVIMDELDVYNSTKSGNVSDITSRRNAKQAQIDSKTSQITTLQNQEKSIQSQLDSLRTNVQMSNFLTPEQMLELNDYIITKDYTNDSIVDEEDLLADGIEAFKTFRQPKVNLNIDIVNFLKNLESQNDWDKLGLGDTIYIKNSRLDVDISAKITEIQFNLTGEDINLTLANEHEILDSDELFLKKIYDAANTSTSVNMNQWKWDLVEETNSLVHRLLTEGLNAAERAITAGYKQNISISERGIIIRSDQEPHKWIVMQNGVIGLTNNNGNSWEVAITPDGVYAQTLIGKIIMGSRLIIEDEDGIIRLSGSKQEIFDAAGNQKVVLGEYETDKYGLKIYNGAIEIVNGLPENQIDPKATEKWNSAEQNAKDYAKEYADELKTSIDNEITDVRDALGEFSEEVNTTFKDGVISEAEAKSIETYINILTTEKADVDRRYTAIYNDESLTDSAVKSTLSTTKTNYNTSHNNLIEAVQNAIADDATTEAEKMNVDSKFADYRDKLSALTQQIEIAIRSIETAKANSAESEANKYTDSKLRDYVTATLYEQDIAEIQSQIDGSITTWFYPYEPTMTNAPANEWTTNDQKNVHLGDIFYNDSNGYAYRFALKDGTYQWLRITDSDVTKALEDASNAQDTADAKRRVFVSQPVPPYDVGDLWTQGPGGEIFRCIKSRQTGSYNSADWDKASGYTDDSRAIAAEKNAKEYADGLKATIDEEIGDIEDALGNLSNDINTTFRDGVISEAEARSIEKYINIVNSEKADVDARYNTIYEDSELTGTAKTNLSSKKTAYNTAHTDLINSINTAISDNETTADEKTDVDAKFSAYRTALSNLSMAFETAIDAIAQSKVDNVRIGGRNLILNSSPNLSPDSHDNDFYRNTKLIVTNPSDTTYSDFPNPPLGGVFNNYNPNTGKITRGVIDFPPVTNTAIALINLYEKTNDPVYLDRATLIGDYIISTGIESSFYGSMFYLIPNRNQFISGAWQLQIGEINARTQYQALWVMSELYRVSGVPIYRDIAIRIMKTVGSIMNNVNVRVEREEIEPYMYGASYDLFYLTGTPESSSMNYSWTQFAQSNADVLVKGVQSYIDNIGNETMDDYEHVPFTPSAIIDNFATHLKSIYNNGMLTMEPTGLPYSFFVLDRGAVNWDWVDTFAWGDTWFANDAVLWIIEGIANMGRTDTEMKAIARRYRDNFLALRSTDHPTYVNDDNEVLFYDRYNFDGSHLEDDASLSISGTGLLWIVDEYLGIVDAELHSEILETLKRHRYTSINDPNIDGAYGWDAATDDAIVEVKATGEIYHSKFLDVVVNEFAFVSEGYLSKIVQLSEDLTDEEYTFSLKGYIQPDKDFNLHISNGDASLGLLKKNKDGIYTLTFRGAKPRAGTERSMRLYDFPNNGSFFTSIKWMKLEKGNKATDWTPAVEDITGEIGAVRFDVGDVNIRLENLNEEIKGSFKDGVINEAEARAIEKYINSLTAEKGDLDSRYTSLYSDVNLTGTAKTNLQSAKNAYNTAHTNLISSINSAIADGEATSAESADVDAKFTAYRTALNTLATRLEEAIKAISAKNASDAESRANSYTDGKIQTVNQQIGELNTAVGTLEEDLNTMLEDGVLGAEERARLNALLDVLTIEKADVDEQYSAVYADANIPPANQTALQTTKTALNTSHDSLIATINTALSDNLISDAEKTSINAAFTDYKEKLTTFSQTVNTAILAIAQNVGEKVDTKLRKYADDSSGAVRNDLRLVAPLPNNITMDASGITASTSSSSSFAALDYRGLYVQGGAFDLRTGSASNRGVKIDGSGIHAYNSSGTRTFYVDTNGNLNASSGTFSGSITGATGTFYGNLYAAGGTFKGTLSAVNGTFTSLTSGTISSAKITGTEITGGSITGTTITSTGSTGETIISAGTISHSRSFGSGENQSISIGSGSMIARYGNDLSGIDYYGRYQHNGVYMTSSSANYTTTYAISGISAFRYGSGTRQTFTIEANTVFQGTVNFSGATVTGLDLTAKFG